MRINALRRGLTQGSIADEDQSLAVMLREIGALEQGLLQANEDALAICDRVMEKTRFAVEPLGRMESRTELRL